ncbi:MAG TPA: S53 family peptidase [Ktedonobacteraceae bacterium]|nr:S53 family peptidase [Ktedonobacteraceae bacterium]
MVKAPLSHRGECSRRRFVLFALPLVCMLVMGSLVSFRLLSIGTSVQASGLVRIAGHVPELENKSTLLGSTDPNTPVQIVIGLRPRNAQALKSQADALAQVRQAQTRRYLTPDQVATAFAPAAATQSALIAYMQGQGFSLTNSYRDRLVVGFKGTIGIAEKAFGVQINNYRAPGGRVYYAPSNEPGMPANLAPQVQSIVGLDDTIQYTHPPVQGKSIATRTVAQPNAASCLPAQPGPIYTYYLPSQIQSAYNLVGLYNQGYQGQGQTVALLELDDYTASDISAYTACYGGASVPISRVLVNGGTGMPPGSNANEVELDIDLVLSAAPKLAGLKVYEAAATTAGYLAVWTQIVNDAVPIVGSSWGDCETNTTSAVYQQENTLFQVAELQGQSLFAAAGDKGTNDCASIPAKFAVDDPASQPYVTGVGGTSLTIGPNNAYGSEAVWNDSFGAGGGGVSSLWTMPTYQSGDANTISATYSSRTPCGAAAGTYCREVPDVSINADPKVGYPIYCTVAASCGPGNTWVAVGGTSAGPPLWAAMTAILNQKLLQNGFFNVGFLNGYLYAIDQGQNGTHYANDFHDVTVGTNDTVNSTHTYPATSDYDMTSGLGSYNAQNLVSDVASIVKATVAPRTNEANTTWYFAEGSVGGSFTEYLTILNPDPVNIATIQVDYLFQNQPAVLKLHQVLPSTRFTINVNSDLNIASTAPQQAISMIVQSIGIGSTAPVPVVAERPMYFNYRGVKSGTDVLGATNATNTTFYFAEGDNRQSGNAHYSTFITVLNPSNIQTATVTATFYTGACGLSSQPACPTSAITVPPLYRGTILPPVHSQFSAMVTSTSGVVVERPMYFTDVIPTAGGATSGSASAVGATALGPSTGSDWLFAEGYTGPNFQEYLVLADFTSTNTQADVKLEYTNGTVQTVPVTVPALSQVYFDVNHAYTNPVPGCNCTPTQSVSAEVIASTASIVAERLMYFHYGPQLLSGATDVVGQAGPASKANFSFAEGYTNTNFSEYLTIQNPLNSVNTVSITLFADNTIVEEMLQLQPHSRTTVFINSFIAPMAAAYPTNPVYLGYNVSMSLESSSPIVAERPLYFNYSGDTGGTDVIGYSGG